MTTPFRIAALYKFVDQPDFAELQAPMAEFCDRHGLRGTLLLAPEGINGTVAGKPHAIDALVDWLDTGFAGRFAGAEIKFATADAMPFHRMKVRLKSEIVTLKAPEANPGRQVGTYVEPADWNGLIARKDVTLIDTRNAYEIGLGSFPGARDPGTETFTQFKDYVAAHLDPARDRTVAMFCTGGIRCEKASSYLLAHGFEEVFHLKGGILNYLETVPEPESVWEGECFVFDERVSITHGLEKGQATLCRACRQPLTPADRKRPEFEEGVCCHHCHARRNDEDRTRAAERQRQIVLAAARGDAHIGDDAARTAATRRAARKRAREADRMRNRAATR